MNKFLQTLLVICLFAPAEAVLADADPDTFPPEIRALEWREVGPYRGGRVAAVAGLPADRQTYYMGATGGGVWKTTDGGKSWSNSSDGYFGGSIGAVAVSEWDSNVIYVGTGEKTVRGNVSPGNGLWKSTDAGETWSRSGLEETQHIARIRIHPKDSDIAYVAAMGHLFGPNDQRGVFRTVDGGQSWQRVLFVDSDTGAVDLIMDPTNPRILYAGTWQVRRTPHSLESGGEGSGLYRSTDGGDTWQNISANEGLPRGIWGAVGITVSPSNNKNLYAMIEATDGGLYRSTDGGQTWAQVNEERKLRQRAWYYTRLYADPVDEESVYVLNVRFHRSKDGGLSFKEVDTPHGDNHDLWIDPADPLRMIEGNDGGATVSFDGGATWSTLSNQPTAQMYRVSTDNAFPYRLLGGQQDNTSVRIRSRSARGWTIGTRDWESTAGGESGHISAKPNDPDIVVGGSYGGYLGVVNHRSGETRAVNVWPEDPMGWGAADLKYRFQWNYPLEFSIHDPEVLYAAANVLFRSDDMGRNWQAISTDLTRNDRSRMGPSGGPITKDNTSVEYYGTIFALAQARGDANVLWAGSDDGLIHVTRDGGKSWTNVTPRGLPQWAQVNSIEAHPTEAGGAYAAATLYKSDDFQPLLYRTTDWGNSWTKITGGIPDGYFTRVVRADPDRPGLLYAGTERGIFYSLDDGRNWKSLQLDLPIVPITDLAVKENNLVAATQGRGFWILDDLAVLHQINPGSARRTRLYTPDTATRLVAGGRADEPTHAGSNPHVGVSFFYELPEDVGADTEISLSVYDSQAADATSIWTWTRKPDPDADGDEDESAKSKAEPDTRVLEAKPGLNRHVWDLNYPGMKKFDDLILWGLMENGPRAVPGLYRAQLKVGEEKFDAPFEVRIDPRSESSVADLKAQFDFVRECRDLLSRTHSEIGRIRQVRQQLKAVQGRLADDDSGGAQLEALLEHMDGIEKTLYQTQNESRQDPLNFPIRLNNKLNSVMRMTAMGDAAPTTQALAVKAQLSAQIEGALSEIENVWTVELPAINRALDASGVQILHLPEGESVE